MAGDPLGGAGKLWKVLCIKWDTAKDDISVEVKTNYGEKSKGTYTEIVQTSAALKPTSQTR
jgi:hypothetical protein